MSAGNDRLMSCSKNFVGMGICRQLCRVHVFNVGSIGFRVLISFSAGLNERVCLLNIDTFFLNLTSRKFPTYPKQAFKKGLAVRLSWVLFALGDQAKQGQASQREKMCTRSED